MKASFTMDSSEFRKGLEKLENLQKAYLAGAEAVYKEMKSDVENVSPKIPVDTGDLANSAKKVIVINKESVSVDIEYESEYALRQHEQEMKNYSKTGSGPNYLASKLRRFKEKYNAIIGKAVAEELKK